MLRNSPVASKNWPKVLHINQRPLREFPKKDLVSLYMDAPDYNPTSSPLSLSVSSKMESFLTSKFSSGPLTEFDVSGALIDQQKIEKMLFGEEIKNIIACEGVERKERHEKLEKWILRLELDGFGRVHFSFLGMIKAKELLQSYDHQYNVKEENGCLVICWRDNSLFSLSAWR
nr:scarecrow-like protein 3 [Quercus suber]